MDFQVAFNIAVILIGALASWVLKTITDKLNRLQTAEDSLRDKIQEIHILVAGKYVTTDSLDKFSNAIFTKLDKIESKLDSKQDKD